jgi:hypothetical protein
MTPQLTQVQLEALIRFAHRNGRRWKSALVHAWITGDYDNWDDVGYLQQIKNQLGRSWLVNYQLPKKWMNET